MNPPSGIVEETTKGRAMADPREDPLSPGREVDWSDRASRHLVEGEPEPEREELAEEQAVDEIEPDGPERAQEEEIEPELETQQLERLEEIERAEQDLLEEERRIEREQARENREPAEQDAAAGRARDLDEERADLRAEAAGERRVGREDDARATALDYRAAGDDGPVADAERTKADRLRAHAAHQDRIANYDEARADELGAEAQQEARAATPSPNDGSQPPAAEAVRNPPRAPRARRNVRGKAPSIQREREPRR